VSVRAQNLFDEDIQHHVWGDILRRKVVAQVALEF
jgi:hypothetical protein